MGADHEPVMIDFLLSGAGLMAVKAIDAPLRVCGHLVFVYDRILKPGVAFGAFSRGPDEVSSRLCRFDARTRPIHKKSSQNERECDDDSQEHRTKRHAVVPREIVPVGRAGAKLLPRTEQ